MTGVEVRVGGRFAAERGFSPAASFLFIAGMSALLGTASLQNPPAPQQNAPQQNAPQAVDFKRIRQFDTIRLGGVYTYGLGNSDATGPTLPPTKLSADNEQWIADNCDVIALNAANIDTQTFPALYKAQKLFTPLLLLSATTLHESPETPGEIGGWKPEWKAWERPAEPGKPLPPGLHRMDARNPDWTATWRDQAIKLVGQYAAQGVVATDLPLDSASENRSSKLENHPDRVEATETFLQAVRARGRYLMVPSAQGFDGVAFHPVPPLPPGAAEPNLQGLLWDDLFALTEGAWMDGWLRPDPNGPFLPEARWELELEAADSYGRNGLVFIAATPYRNDAELEFALASYLLIVHHQGRCVFQPLPIDSKGSVQEGYSLANLRHIVAAKSYLLNVRLGDLAFQERHQVPIQGGLVWRRTFQFGVVYVNSSDTHHCSLQLGGGMLRANGQRVKQVELPPHSGVILLYPTG